MGPADLNSSTNANDDARLEALLRRAAPALPDDGFSARVLAALPAPEAEGMPLRRIAFCVAGGGTGCALALWQGLSWPGLQSGLGQIARTLANASPLLVDPLVCAALVVTTLSLLFAFRSELREKLMS